LITHNLNKHWHQRMFVRYITRGQKTPNDLQPCCSLTTVNLPVQIRVTDGINTQSTELDRQSNACSLPLECPVQNMMLSEFSSTHTLRTFFTLPVWQGR